MDSSVIAFREGYVQREAILCWNCCERPDVGIEKLFSYLEFYHADGSRTYLYEDTEAFSRFEANFHAKRFTSFHEFFTTETKLEEDRGGFALAYYERKDKGVYTVGSIKEAKAALENVKQLPDRITVWGRYDRKVNYHEGENEEVKYY